MQNLGHVVNFKAMGFCLFVFLDFHQEKWIYVHKGSTKEVSTHLFVKENAYLYLPLGEYRTVSLGVGDAGLQPTT